MSIWRKLSGIKKGEYKTKIIGNETAIAPYRTLKYAIVDVEVGLDDHKIHDIGSLKQDGSTFHKASREDRKSVV